MGVKWHSRSNWNQQVSCSIKFSFIFIGIIAYASQSLDGHQSPAENEKLTGKIVNQTTSAGIDVIGIFFFEKKEKQKHHVSLNSMKRAKEENI